ncbi:hypothetical protein [Neptunicella marina]|uniref:Uncharacterized protein n=1 Tax=Neptunicella marina TaxID=2125989 RepID=A0A8J6M3B0_9ALTE|nr:hypothetical protein [Neptunicella marina]MBC3767318.1 hypothetical protein [Neptunicella marina]
MSVETLAIQHSLSPAGMIGKTVFIKRGEFQAKRAKVLHQLGDDEFELKLLGSDESVTCHRGDFVPMCRHRPNYSFHFLL